MSTANIIYEDISILNVSSWQHWIAVSEVDYCDGLIYINISDKTFEMTKRYYVTGNFSKYIPFGAEKIGVKCGNGKLKVLAFRKDDETVLIVINDTDSAEKITLEDAKGSVRLVVTDKDNDLAEKQADKNIEIPAKSVNTIIF